jgi:hypothetical protein
MHMTHVSFPLKHGPRRVPGSGDERRRTSIPTFRTLSVDLALKFKVKGMPRFFSAHGVDALADARIAAAAARS